jgi:hypothetical protein
MNPSGQATPNIAVARTGEVVPPLPLEFWGVLLLAVAVLATPASFAPIADWKRSSMVLNGKGGQTTYRLGMVLPWGEVTNIWDKTAGRDQWRRDSFSGKRLAVHLAFHSLVWGAVIILWVPVIRRWWRRRRVTRGLTAAVEQAAVARWGPSASGPWAPSVCRPGSHLGPPPEATKSWS